MSQKANILGWPCKNPPNGLQIKFVGMENEFMQKAFTLALKNEFKDMTVTASVVVKNGRIIGQGINGNGYHQKNKKCARKELALPAGVGYDKCPGCCDENHSERVAIRMSEESVEGSEIYMYGHWWICESCMENAKKAGIKTMLVLENSRPIFDRNFPNQKQTRSAFEAALAKNIL